jgi:thiamine biosynthesis lipoprotein
VEVADRSTVRSLRFRVMGCDALVVLHGGPHDLPPRAEARLRDLAARWTRFDENSELSAINAGSGHAVTVSAETFAIVRLALDAWQLTGGWFDPTVLPMLINAGYDRSFDRVIARPHWNDGPASAAPGCADIVLDEERSTVHLPVGVAIDLGGIGKGRAADLVASELMAAGALGVCVDLGGDMAVAGTTADGDAWVIGIEDPFADGRDVARVALGAGAVATSSRLERQWRSVRGPSHHLIDPTTGRPAQGRLATVSVVASTAVWAEVLTKATLVSGDEGIPGSFNCTGLVVGLDGTVRHLEGLEDWLL